MMRNKTITLLVTGDPPAVFSNCHYYPIFEPTIFCLFPGWVMEITKMLAEYLNADIIPIIANSAITSEGYGYKVDGQWKGFLSAVQNETVDIVTSFYQYTDARAADFVYSYPVYSLKLAAFVKAKERTIGGFIWSSFEPFTWGLWILIFGAVLVQAAFGTFVQKIEQKLKLIKVFYKFEHFWLYIRLLLLQGEDRIPFISQSGHLAFLVYTLLLVTLFTNLYQGSLLSALLQETNLKPFKNWDEMIRMVGKKEFHFVANSLQTKTTWYYSTLLTANDSMSLQFQSAIKDNPIVIKDTEAEAVALITQGPYVFIIQEDEGGAVEVEKYCNILKVTDGLPEKTGHYLFRPDNPLIHEINAAIVMNDGFIRRTYQKYFLNGYQLGNFTKCSGSNEFVSEAQRPLDIISTFGIFMIFIISIILCLISFAVERCLYFYYFKQRRQIPSVIIRLHQTHLKTS